MALTRDVMETIKARADLDAEFHKALVAEAIECLLNGDFDPPWRSSRTISVRRRLA